MGRRRVDAAREPGFGLHLLVRFWKGNTIRGAAGPVRASPARHAWWWWWCRRVFMAGRILRRPGRVNCSRV